MRCKAIPAERRLKCKARVSLFCKLRLAHCVSLTTWRFAIAHSSVSLWLKL